jgi:hypothetical protein
MADSKTENMKPPAMPSDSVGKAAAAFKDESMSNSPMVSGNPVHQVAAGYIAKTHDSRPAGPRKEQTGARRMTTQDMCAGGMSYAKQAQPAGMNDLNGDEC